MSNGFVKLQEDPVKRFVKEIFTKKPVNSEFNSVIKRIKPGGKFTKKNSQDQDLDTIESRSKKLLNQMGFAYGRVQKKSLSVETKRERSRLRAPGPVTDENKYEPPEVKIDETSYTSRKKGGFVKAEPVEPLSSKPEIKPQTASKPKPKPTQSQLKAKELLGFLSPLSQQEIKTIHKDAQKKYTSYLKRSQQKEKLKIASIKQKGIFSEAVNQERIKGMKVVNELSLLNSKVKPFIWKARNQLINEKQNKTEIQETPRSEETKRNTLMDVLENAMFKNVVRTSKRQDSPVRKQKSKPDKDKWTENLYKSINGMIRKYKPSEKISNMPVHKLNVSS